MSIFGSETKLALKNARKSTDSIGFSSPAKAVQITPKPKAKMLAKQPVPNIPPRIPNSGSPAHQHQPGLTTPLMKKLPVAFPSSDEEDESDGSEEEETSEEDKALATAKKRVSEEEDEEESEEESDEEDINATAKSNVLLTAKNKASLDSNLCPSGYSVLTPSGMISAETLRDPDNEIFLVKLPSVVKAKSLINKPLPLVAGKKVIIDGKELETVIYQGTKGNTLVLAENRAGSLEAAGNVHFQTSLDVPSLPPLTEWPRPEPPLRELPLDLKVRHPLLGSDYEAILAGLAPKEKKSRKKKASLLQLAKGQPVLTQEPSKKKKRIKKVD